MSRNRLRTVVGASIIADAIDAIDATGDPVVALDPAWRRMSLAGDDGPLLLGFGASAISRFSDLIVQNEKRAGSYRDPVGEGCLTAVRGVASTVCSSCAEKRSATFYAADGPVSKQTGIASGISSPITRVAASSNGMLTI